MKREYDVFWTDTAADDLRSIILYIKNDSPDNAKNVLAEIREYAEGLYLFPERGRVVPEFQEQGILQYRELIVSRWRVIYKVTGKTVYILSVIDSRQNVEDMLFQRFVGK